MSDRVIDVFAEVLQVPADELNDDSSPENTPKWDSLTNMNLVLAIEDEFSVRLSTKDIVSMRSIAIVKKVLREKDVAGV